MHEACKLLKRKLAVDRDASPHSRAHFLVKLWRDLRANRWEAIRGWASRISYLEQYVDIEQQIVIDHEGLAKDIRQANEELLNKDLEELEEDKIDANRNNRSAARRAGLIRQLNSWRQLNPRIPLTNVMGDDGPCGSPRDAATLLARHWSKVFSHKTIDPAAWNIFDEYMVTNTPKYINYVLTETQFEELLVATPDTAPGPDGIPYSGWAALGPDGCKFLYQQYLQLFVSSPSPPDGSMHSLFAFLAKVAR